MSEGADSAAHVLDANFGVVFLMMQAQPIPAYPIPGMDDLGRDLHHAKVAVGALFNLAGGVSLLCKRQELSQAGS